MEGGAWSRENTEDPEHHGPRGDHAVAALERRTLPLLTPP